MAYNDYQGLIAVGIGTVYERVVSGLLVKVRGGIGIGAISENLGGSSMRAKSIQQLLRLNHALLNAEPIVKVNGGVVYLDFFYSGRAYVKPVYMDENATLVKRVGEVIYMSFPRSWSEDAVLKSLFGKTVQRKHISILYNRLYAERNYPSTPITGGFGHPHFYYKGVKYKVENTPSFKNTVCFEGDTVHICQRQMKTRCTFFHRWKLAETAKHLEASQERIRQRYGFDFKLAITPRQSNMIGIKTLKQDKELNFPVDFISVPDHELDVVMLYVMLRYKIDAVEDIGVEYPYLYELMQFIVKKWGFHTEATRQICIKFKCFSDSALANMGKRMYPFMNLIMQGRPEYLEKQIKNMLA